MESLTTSDERARITQLAATCACNNLRRVSRVVTNYYDALLKEHLGQRIRITQVTMLVVLYLAGPQTINDMAQQLDLDRTTLTRNLKPLEEAGLLSIVPGADQRTRVVTVTTKGEQTLLEALPLWEQAQAHIVDGIGPERFRGWLAQLAEVAALAHNT